MTGHFSATTLILCGLAARMLGWRPPEFWASTPAELAAALGLSAQNSAPSLDLTGLRDLFGDQLEQPWHG